MATMFKTFMENDIVSTRTLLHESIPITGSIVSGTYFETGAPKDTETNIKNYSHGLFQSVYDYPYLSSSANQIFDLTVGYSNVEGGLSGTTGTRSQQSDKINIYNQMAQILAGHDTNGNIRRFDRDGDLSGGNKMDSLFFVNFSRLLVKDEIKKGSFKIQLITGSAGNNPAATRKNYASTSKATATITIDDAGQCLTGCTISVITTALDTVTITGVASGASAMSDTTGASTTGTFAAGATVSGGTTNNKAQALAIAQCLDLHDDISAAAVDSATVTITQATAGTAGNTSISTANESAGSNGGSDMTAATTIVNFTGGSAGNLMTLQDHNGETSYLTNSPAGEYGLLFSASADAAETGLSKGALGHIYYQAGIAVITSSVFRSPNYLDANVVFAETAGVSGQTHAQADKAGAFGWIPGHVHGTDLLQTGSVEAMFVSASISASCSGFRNSLYNIEFNNTTELNSTIYFCRASHNEFNYSSNPTYVDASKIIVKNNTFDQPVSYITSIGLYSAKNELLAVAKLSEPIKKTPDTELTFRVRLDY